MVWDQIILVKQFNSKSVCFQYVVFFYAQRESTQVLYFKISHKTTQDDVILF